MGSICSRSSAVDIAPSGGFSLANGHFGHGSGLIYHSHEVIAHRSVAPSVGGTSVEIKQPEDPLSPVEVNGISHGISPPDIDDGIPRLLRVLSDKSLSTKSKQAAISRVTEMSSLLGRAGTAGLGKAVDVLDTLGSSMTNLSISNGFTSGVATKGDKISILAFEVANTIVKGANLMHSLSQDNIRHLKEVVLPSEGVQNLISRDMNELLRIAAADKREELKVFSGEVVRFGNRCRDPQWHNLDRFFDKLGSELIPEKQLKEEAETMMQQLMTLVNFTAELYHEMHALDRFQQDYQRKLQEEEKQNPGQKGDNLAIFKADIKSQKKHVKSLKRKSLWSKILEEVMEKLVDIVHFLHLEIYEAFPSTVGDQPLIGSPSNNVKLGSAGLALHYANIITQIDTLVSRSSSVPPNTRDAFYQALPLGVKSALRSRLQSFPVREELSVQQIKGEMEKTLQWLVPIATNTSKAHHGFGWVGEWANTGSEVNRKAGGQIDFLRIETLHHADKEKTETYILELVIWLHHLVIQARAGNCGMRSTMKSPVQSPTEKIKQISMQKPKSLATMLTVEDQEMLRDVSKRNKTPGISKSQEFDTAKIRLCKHHRLSKSSSHSPTRESKRDHVPVRRQSLFPVIDFDIDRMKALDVIDRVDSIQGI